MHNDQLIAAAVAAITHDLVPVASIPRRAAESMLRFWSDATKLSARQRELVLATFRTGPPKARYGQPFTPLPVDECRHPGCGAPISLTITPRPGSDEPTGEWLHDITPVVRHAAQPATPPARPVTSRPLVG